MYDVNRCFSLLEKLSFNRLAGTKEEKKAIAILKEEIEKEGLVAQVEGFEIDATNVKVAKLKVLEPYEKEYVVTGVGMTGSTLEEGINKELVYIENVLDVNLVNIEDKIVLINGRMINKFYKEIVKGKAAGFISFSGSVYDTDEDSDLLIRTIREKDYELGKIPGVNVRALDAEELVRKGASKVNLTLIQEEGKTTAHNVISEIKGTTNPSEVVVITAHYDSVEFSSGAYDNASGSVGIMELLHHFKENPPKRTVRFIWCGAEEKGLLGSKNYCQVHKEELESIVFNLNIDMIGVVLGREIAVCTSEMSLVNYITYLGREIGIAVASSQGVYSSDSTPFADNGIPSVSFARISPSGGCEIHSRRDVITYMSKEAFASSLTLIQTFLDRMVNAYLFPVKRTIPDNMKEEIDYYFLRKERPTK
ncbi:MAG: M28 family peptidase [Bacilli bacterium]